MKATRFIVMFGMASALMSSLYGEESGSGLLRVAVMKSSPSIHEAIRFLCQKEYPGMVRVTKIPSGGYAAVNILPVEDYLVRCLGCEMDPRAPLEALKAQAIAARSHAVFRGMTCRDQPYDLVANLSQAYQGNTRLQKNVVLALESTRDQLLTLNGKILPSYFHDSCGGHTLPSIQAWPQLNSGSAKSDVLSVEGVGCPACLSSKESRWIFNLSRATLTRSLTDSGFCCKGVQSLKVLKKDPHGRALNVEVQMANGTLPLSAEELRRIVGYSNLKSSAFEVSEEKNADGSLGDLIQFVGSGRGHGVGLCQKGAQAMAAKGANCRDILSFYYPKSKVVFRPSSDEAKLP